MNRLFIISKPIQYLIALTIKEQLDNGKNNLLVIKHFQDPELFIRKVEKSDWFYIYSTYNKAKLIYLIGFNKYDEIYIDSDVGFLNYLLLFTIKVFRPRLVINVFEEGMGTYFSENYFYNKFKLYVYSLLGIGTNFGSCIFTTSIFLYDIDRYLINCKRKPNNVFKIEKSIEDICKNNFNFLDENCVDLTVVIESYKPKLENCLIILGTWIEPRNSLDSLDNSILKAIEEANYNSNSDLVIVKEHPNLNRRNNIPDFKSSIIFNSSTPAEFLIFYLLSFFKTIKVIHHESTVSFYVKSPQVKFFNY